MQRVCFRLQVKPDRIEEYKARHAAVWPEMLRALARTGWHNYSLFLGEDGLPTSIQLVGPPVGEELLISVAAQLEAERPWADRRPELVRGSA